MDLLEPGKQKQAEQQNEPRKQFFHIITYEFQGEARTASLRWWLRMTLIPISGQFLKYERMAKEAELLIKHRGR